jgi:hypothetical protein
MSLQLPEGVPEVVPFAFEYLKLDPDFVEPALELVSPFRKA